MEMYYPSKDEFVTLAKKGNLIPIYRELMADLETPVSAFMKIEEDYSYLLESVEGGERIGRYSFLGNKPSMIFKSKGNQIEILERTSTAGFDTKKFATQKDPLFEIEQLMKNYVFVPVRGLPRFCGGLVGYMGYDVVRFFEKIPHNNPDDLGVPEAFFVLTETIVIFDHIEHKIKIVSNAHIKDGSRIEDIERTYDDAIRKIDEVVMRLRKSTIPACWQRKPSSSVVSQSSKSGKSVRSNFTKQRFENVVRKAKKYIRTGDIIQVVLSQRFERKLTAEPLSIYRALRSINPSPYMYYLKYKGLSLIGSSPELLVRCEGGNVQVRPIAGTRPRGRDAAEDKKLIDILLSDPKERAEHVMLVDLGRNDIGRVCEYGSVVVSEFMIIEKYSHVMHIVSEARGKLAKGKDQFELIRSAFPAGTVTGAPKIRAMEIIDELESVRRGPYAGLVGYFSFSGNLDTCITIRTIVIKDSRAFVQAGAGIVADSDPSKEYQETVNKAKAMLKAIELAERGLE